MASFYKKETLTKTITFMAIMAAINVIFALLTAFVPFLSVALVIFLPLTSALVEIECKDKYFPIYAFGTIGLSIAATFWNIDFTIFYVIPSILTGFIFGIMSKHKVSPMFSVLAATSVQTVISFLFVPFIEFLTGNNLIDIVFNLFKLPDVVKDYVLVIFFLFSLVQIVLSYFAISYELKRFNVSQKKISEIPSFTWVLVLAAIVLSIPFLFIYKNVSYFFVILSLFFTFFIVYSTASNKRFKKLIIYSVVVFLNIFFFALLNPIMPYGQILLIQFSPLLIAVFSLLKI